MNERLQEISLGIAIGDQQRVLIVRRAKEERGTGSVKLSWAFPGGKVETGETKEEAVEREIFEETGYRVSALKIISERQHPQFPVYVYYFECRLLQPEQIGRLQSEEIKEVKWVSPQELRSHFTTDLNDEVAAFLGL